MRKYPLATFLKQFCIFLFLIAAPAHGWSAFSCPIKTSISYSMNGKTLGSGASVDEALAQRPRSAFIFSAGKNGEAFSMFAKHIEANLLALVEKKLCPGEAANAPVSVELTFVELTMHAPVAEIAQARAALAGMRGPYADVRMDQKDRLVQATVVWSPRQMLRDRLSYEGWEFEEEAPLLPFSSTQLCDFVHRWGAAFFASNRNKQTTYRVLGAKHLNDMVALILAMEHYSPRVLRGCPEDEAGYSFSIITYSYSAYITIIDVVLKSFYESDTTLKITRPDILNRLDVRQLYLTRSWANHVLPLQ